jgi:hypothetical protein
VDRDHRRSALDRAHAVRRHRGQREVALAPEPIEEARDAGAMIDERRTYQSRRPDSGERPSRGSGEPQAEDARE